MLISQHDPKFEQHREEYLQLRTIYAHGKLEDMLEFDIVATSSIPVYNKLHEFYSTDGRLEVNTQAMDPKGNVHEVTIYAWKVDHHRIKGYAVLRDDIESIQVAKEEQNLMLA